MSLNDSSAIILIVGAIAVIAFVIHGLWFSGRSVSRKLSRSNTQDQELEKSDGVGKVRIVRAETLGTPVEDASAAGKINVSYGTPAAPVLQQGAASIPGNQPYAAAAARSPQPEKNYEINLIAAEGKPYAGEDIDDVCMKYGFVRGEHDIFLLHESNAPGAPVVFRICSLKEPFCFPRDMRGYHTNALAIYMNLPEKGKAFEYFKAMRLAAETFSYHLGGTLKDNSQHDYTPEKLDEISEILKAYDDSDDKDSSIRIVRE